MQGCLTSYCLGVRVCAMLDQVYDDVHVSHESRHVKGCQSRLKQIQATFYLNLKIIKYIGSCIS